MVTSNKLVNKKVVKMAERSSSAVVPQKTLLGEVNAHLTCYLCKGYYIDATTIVECLHSFCRSCIIKHLKVKSYCPVCEMMINSAKPNIKPDKALQDIVYKLVPGLFQREMERRQQFYASRPGPAASTTPEQRGEDTERIIFSPEDVISFSLEYADVTDTDSISSKSSDSNEPQPSAVSTRRYLQCPAVVNISHLKKFLTMKFDIDSTQFSIDILYKRVPLPDYYTLMDIAYIYNWKRNEPMRFFYQITDYIAIRNRYGLFSMNRKGSHFRDLKSSPTPTEDTNASSPTPNLNEQGSELSSGTDSPMPEDTKKSTDNKKCDESESKKDEVSNEKTHHKSNIDHFTKSSEDDIEKSNFLNSFELTAKNQSTKSSPIKTNVDDTNSKKSESLGIVSVNHNKTDTTVLIESNDNTSKRKNTTPPTSPESKKLKVELDKFKSDTAQTKMCTLQPAGSVSECPIPFDTSQGKVKESDNSAKDQQNRVTDSSSNISTNHIASKDITPKEAKQSQGFNDKKSISADQNVLKRPVPGSQTLSSPTKKLAIETQLSSLPQQTQNLKSVSPMKSQINKSDNNLSKPTETQKPPLKKLPDLKLSVPPSAQIIQNKNQAVNKVRMDLLANNSDPTIDRSKILSQVKTSLSTQGAGQVSGDHLKSLFDSCKINIPSSLSITLTDQKLDHRNLNEPATSDPKKPIINKNLALSSTNSNVTHKVPSPPVHNYIEILKLPDVDPKKPQSRVDPSVQNKSPTLSKSTETNQPKSTFNKSSESTSAKGPIPSLKPIADTKLGKSSTNFSKPTTFQQTFLQSLQQSEKSKLPKNKMQVPKLMPATHKSLSTANKDNSCNIPVQNKNNVGGVPGSESKITKSDSVLDLSTPHTSQTQLGDQSKVLETMQSIANLAKKQNLPPKGSGASQNSTYTSMSSRPLITGVAPLRLPSPSNPIKPDKITNFSPLQMGSPKPDAINKLNPVRQSGTSSPSSASSSYQMGPHNSPIAQLSPRSQTRSPSSSPKLVIAEEKQSNTDTNINQSNQVSSTQLANSSASKSELPKSSPGPSKPIPKPLIAKAPPTPKLSGVRPPLPNVKPSSSISALSGILSSLPPLTQQEFLRHRMDMPWMLNQAQQYENLLRNMSSGMYSKQNTFNNKESK